MTITSQWRRSLGVVATAAAFALVPAAAHAATIVSFEYDASGTTHIAKTNSDIALGPTTLRTDLDIDTFDFTGSLPLPGTTTEFKAIGLVPVKAKVDFIEAAPIQGHIALNEDRAEVTSTAKYYVKLSNIKIAGFPTFTGNKCKTKVPVSIPANTRPNEGFDLELGGRLVGTYSIGNFENCGLNTGLINLLVPGSGNTLDLQVSNGIQVS
ncbi:MAG: hypothetical protein ABWY58_13695 [Aeromicrobium sp.]